MPLTKLQFRPGFNKETTDYSNEGGWRNGNKVRFRMGFPEKIGGWQKLSDNSFLGTCRALLPWHDLDGTHRIGVGTNIKYYVEEGGGYYDITPIRLTTAAGDVTFSATNGSSTITVSDTLHGCVVGDFVTFSGAVSLGGQITADVLNQEYRVESVVDADSYTITARTAGTSISSITVDGELVYTAVTADASDTGNGGAAVVGAYQINVAPDSTALGTGWGTGTWGRGTWGSSSSVTAEASQLSAWSHDTFGEDILICRRGGPIFRWDTSVGTSSPAVDISTLSGTDIPTVANRVMVSDRDRHVIAFGVNEEGGSTLDPMLIRFSDQEDYTNWTTSATTSAGSLRLGNGSEIVTAYETRQQTLVMTDTALYAMQYLGPPFTFGINMISKNTSIISPTAGIAVDDAVFWMGDRTFYLFDGSVQEIPCPVLDYVYDTMNQDQAYKVTCGSNIEFGEVWWFYPCSISSECDRYVVYNYKQQIWYTGTLPRSAWVDRANGVVPIAASHRDYHLYYHETGLNDGSTDPYSSIHAYIESSPLGVGEGDQFAFLSRIIPDITFDGSTATTPVATLTVEASDAPGDSYGQSDSGSVSRTATTPVEQFTEQVYLRLRGRQMTFKVESDEANVQWRLGTPRADIRTDGRR